MKAILHLILITCKFIDVMGFGGHLRIQKCYFHRDYNTYYNELNEW